MEKDNAVSPAGVPGANYSTDFREIDTRIGRWWSRDPIVKPWESPYVTFGDNPIAFADPSGLTPGAGDGPNTDNISEGCDPDPKIPAVQLKEVVIFAAKPTRSEILENNANRFIVPDDLAQKRREQDERVKTTNETINGLYIGFGIAATLPVAVSAGIAVGGTSAGAFIGRGFVNSGLDLGAQLYFNDFDFNKLNYSSLGASFFFNRATSWGGLLTKSVVANGLEYNTKEGYKGFGGVNSNLEVLAKVGIGFALDKSLVSMQNLNSAVTRKTYTHNLSLSSRKQYAAKWMVNYLARQSASSFYNSAFGEFKMNLLDNALTNF